MWLCARQCRNYCHCALFQVWDTIRRVRCLWEGNIKESLSVSLAIGMLNQETVTFSGDTAVARLDIQVPVVCGLVHQTPHGGWSDNVWLRTFLSAVLSFLCSVYPVSGYVKGLFVCRVW
jgi:hypothetical protein